MTRDQILGVLGAPSLLPEQPRDPRAPSGGWFSAGAVQGWQGVASGRTNANASARQIVWTTPVYDVRPEFGSWPQPTAAPQNRGQVPIWPNVAGGKAQLFVEIAVTQNAPGTDINGLNITATTVGHPWDPNALRVVVPEQDVSMFFLSSNSPRTASPAGSPGYFGQNTLQGFATFTAPGSADSPMRFWQLQIAIRNWQPLIADPTVVINAGYY